MSNTVKALTQQQVDDIKKKEVEKEFFEAAKDDDVEFLVDTPEPETVDLQYPLKVRGVEYRSLTIHPMEGSDFSRMQRGSSKNIDPEILSVAVLTRTPVAVISRLQADDMIRLMERLPDFLPRASLTEEEPNGEDGLDT